MAGGEPAGAAGPVDPMAYRLNPEEAVNVAAGISSGAPAGPATQRPPAVPDYSRPAWWQRHPGRVWLLLLLPVVIYLGVFFLYPLLQILRESLFTPDFTLASYRRVFGEPTYLRLILNTLILSVQVTIGTLLIGYPIAVWLSRLRGRPFSVALAMVMLPLWTSALVRNYAWIIVLRRGGPVSNLVEALGMPAPHLLYNETTVLAGMIYTLLPYMVFTLYNSVRTIDMRLISAAQGLGASPARTFLKVFLPLSLPAVSAACLLVFVIAIGFFITPAMLGGGHVHMIAPEIDNQMNLLTDWGFGAALSVVLFVIIAAVMCVGIRAFDVETLGLTRTRGAQTETPGLAAEAARESDTQSAQILARPIATADRQRAYPRPLRAKGRWLLNGFSMAILVLLMLPVVVVAVSSFTASNFIAFPPRGWSLRWYQAVMDDPEWIAAALLSLKAASLSAILSVVLGTVAALSFVRGRFPGARALYALLLAPMIVPLIVMAVGVYFLFVKLHLLGSLWSFVLAYATQTTPIVMLVATSALRRVNVSLERSAMMLGASPLGAFFSVTLPTIWPALAAAGLFAFIHAFDDVVIAEFISGTTSQTLPKKMWVSLVYSIDPTISVVSTVFIVISAALLVCISVIQATARRHTAVSLG